MMASFDTDYLSFLAQKNIESFHDFGSYLLRLTIHISRREHDYQCSDVFFAYYYFMAWLIQDLPSSHPESQYPRDFESGVVLLAEIQQELAFEYNICVENTEQSQRALLNQCLQKMADINVRIRRVVTPYFATLNPKNIRLIDSILALLKIILVPMIEFTHAR